MRTEDIVATIEREGARIATILLPGIQYLTGQVLDIEAITAAGRKAGCVVGWDLAHAVGNVPVSLHDAGADFAVWCNYKYLNGGPGAVGGAFVHARHATAASLPRFAGWWGHEQSTRFLMAPEFKPTPGADGWQLSNPPILAMAPLAASLEHFAAVGLPALRAEVGGTDRLLRAPGPGAARGPRRDHHAAPHRQRAAPRCRCGWSASRVTAHAPFSMACDGARSCPTGASRT